MHIRKVKENELNELARLYRKFYPVHNIFQETEEEVIRYLRNESRKDEILAVEVEGIKAALFVSLRSRTLDHTHCLIKFRHLAYEQEEAATLLLEEAERTAREDSKTAKIEVHAAESEKSIPFLKSKGYTVEAPLRTITGMVNPALSWERPLADLF